MEKRFKNQLKMTWFTNILIIKENVIQIDILKRTLRLTNLIGVQILNLNIDIYYQNTDSVHIDKNKIELLEQKYKEIYGKTLRGGELEQFHPDFDELSGDLYSKESYFLVKKAYIDVLTNDKQENALHMRMKGIPNNLLENNENPIELYKKLYAG
ncbi:hypothetical protein EIN_156820 [Entamoeba invadens IP1]|uniref:Uncharacterized protein n=1 Tax=Entamoeba invadens IP1 TaxID=370355 RepID=L7FJF6_ENTIV|nr:hypothetical protein EIN_156820 [Entamoeba invadens IP1]ELP84042.1 hypothetical protein EIN_156820 [Entamoeba invadens IP1]|eukprot:XP_004183388.1 hypothetical protein EIN_156820 [Entamoeba invadens IP1]